MKVVLGEMVVAWANPYQSGQGEPPVHMAWYWFAPHRPSAVTQFRRAIAFYPVDDVHQDRITERAGGWGMTDEEDR